jgi:protein-tyrosine phosphatase
VPAGAVASTTVLVVCTANQCRSPMAAAMLRRALDGTGVTVLDAGFGDPGHPVTEGTLKAAGDLGLDLSDHLSTRIDAGMLAAANLVLTMERAHVREIVVENPELWAKTFTLKELVRRAEEHGAREPGEPLAGWLARIAQGRARTDLLGRSPLDDVADPTTDRTVDYDTTAEELQELIDKAVGSARLGAR